ncbi:hypothetical protein ScalyP_jg2410 [Parmales sp. scaly parma]|nr:hypothetical protein ScalyP_jg2410 [Parmales sp. scaly parma]
MGNDIGKGANRMAIAAMANVTQFEKRELLALQRKFSDFASREGNPHTITRSEFREALESVGVTESDTEILDRLFTMFDKTGDDQVNFREFVVGVCPLITGDVISKLNFSFELYDIDGTGKIKQVEMTFILSSMNATASYFGDPVMTTDEVDALVSDIFKGKEEGHALTYSEYMTAVAEHPVLVSFITGAGSVRYGSSK